MTDDLTPEERDALKNLPRERMPSAGLEDRVVGAIRDRGFIAPKRPARVVRITRSRVAGLLAACLVLMIGAYSIGLRRGVDNSVLRNIEPRPESGRVQPSVSPVRESRTDAPATVADERVSNEKPQLEWSLKENQLAKSKDVKQEPAAGRAAPEEKSAGKISESAPAADALSAEPRAAKAPASFQALKSEAQPIVHPSRTFILNGSTWIIDAPDSVRVIEDEQGRMLLIYTSDGVIRIRSAH
jgi:hypothetical protein